MASFRKNAGSARRVDGKALGSVRKNDDSPASVSESAVSGDRRFRVLVAVHRPRYRARTERAMRGFDWDVRSLVNKEDPVGKVHQKLPHILVISDDFGRQKDLGILRAVQRFRESGMKIIAHFEDEESALEHADLCDSALSPPWKTADMRAALTELFTVISGRQPEVLQHTFDDQED